MIQEHFQTAYAGMREKQQATVIINAQFYKQLMSKFKIGEWVWVLDLKKIPGSYDIYSSFIFV